MRFERDVSTRAEYAAPHKLEIGKEYFVVDFVDEDMLTPSLTPVVYVGRNLSTEDVERWYFQDGVSHRRGVRFDDAAPSHPPVFLTFDTVDDIGVYEFDQALDTILRCALKRAALLSGGAAG